VTTPTDLESLLKVLRAHGVTAYEGPLWGDARSPAEAVVKVSLGPPVETAQPEAPSVDPDVCKCGHAAFAHVNGLCTVGCDVEKCAPAEETQ